MREFDDGIKMLKHIGRLLIYPASVSKKKNRRANQMADAEYDVNDAGSGCPPKSTDAPVNYDMRKIA